MFTSFVSLSHVNLVNDGNMTPLSESWIFQKSPVLNLVFHIFARVLHVFQVVHVERDSPEVCVRHAH